MNRLILTLVCAIAVGCATAARQNTEVRRQESVASVPGAEWIRTELFFGQSKPDGSLISTNDWNAFLEQNVVRRFPDGLTVLDTTGRYLGEQSHMYREPSKIVILFYASDRASSANSNIAAIVTEYCSQFDQESVLRADSVQKTSFPSVKPGGH